MSDRKVSRRQRVLWVVLALALAAPLAMMTAEQWLPALRAQAAGSGTPAAPPVTVPGLPGTEVPMLPSPHIARLGVAHAEYNSLPPTSGPHLAWTIAPGVYQEAVADELAVHALEHGHVVVRYAPSTSAAEAELLAGVARRYPRDVVVAPYPKLATGIALTAWGRIEAMPTIDTAGVERFVRMLRGRYNHGWVKDWRPDEEPAASAAGAEQFGAGACPSACTACRDGSCCGC